MHAQAQSDPMADARGGESVATFEAVQQAYFLTISTLFRRPLFREPDPARAICRAQADPRIWGGARCLAWVLMPDRWQGLVMMAADDSLDPLVRRFKGITTRRVDASLRVNGWVWAKGYNQRALDSHQDLMAVGRHLVANPVRAGLAGAVGQYPYWDAIWLKTKRELPTPVLELARL